MSTRTLTKEELLDRGYIDVAGNVHVRSMVREFDRVRRDYNPTDIVIKYYPTLAMGTFYIPLEEFARSSEVIPIEDVAGNGTGKEQGEKR